MNGSPEKKLLDIRQMKNGDIHAFEQLFNAYVTPLYAYALGFVKDKATAEDIVQEAYVYLWNKRAKVDYSGNIYHYLQRAVRNSCINNKQHQEVRRRYMQKVQDGENSLSTRWDDEQDLEMVRRRLLAAIDRLPEKSRRIFVMSAVEGLRHKEISSRTGLSENTVKSYIARSYKRLREDTGISKEDLMFWAILMRLPFIQ